jgi:hypothetical protein
MYFSPCSFSAEDEEKVYLQVWERLCLNIGEGWNAYAEWTVLESYQSYGQSLYIFLVEIFLLGLQPH